MRDDLAVARGIALAVVVGTVIWFGLALLYVWVTR